MWIDTPELIATVSVPTLHNIKTLAQKKSTLHNKYYITIIVLHKILLAI